MTPTNAENWQQKAAQYYIGGDYSQAASLYEQAIATEPEIKSHYWHLGLMFLLQGQETEAQMTWLVGMQEGEPEEIDLWTVELIQILQTEAERRETLGDYSMAWAIRQHMREINPGDINNLLHLIQLSIELKTFTGEELNSLGAIENLQSDQPVELDADLLLQVLRSVLAEDPLHPASLKFTQSCIIYIDEIGSLIDTLIETSVKIAYSANQSELAARFLELALELDAENTEVLYLLSSYYQNYGDYTKGIETAKLYYSLVQELPEKVFANHIIIRGLMVAAGEYWQEASLFLDRHEKLLLSLFEAEQTPIQLTPVIRLFSSTYFLPYLRDDLQNNRKIHNQVAKICQYNIQNIAKEQAERYQQKQFIKTPNNACDKPLKIGYVSDCLRRHSVGWLARWLFKYHDREKFKIHAYLINARQRNDGLQEWYIDRVDKAYKSGLEVSEVAEEIYNDEIDILIDLDSITIDVMCAITSLKPAPIQVTWLGWDASGIPAVDYFIADPYVLPESAQDYYSERIWRLPQTYIAVDGFEVGVPTLRREQLNIADDAVIYFSSQRGFKYHPETARLQMQIVKAVPNSYFLIKGRADQESLKNFLTQIADEEGVSSDRLRFLPGVATEDVHRANLGIADVVLDTYPYNGATTTLETLWMGIPLVTRVGEQFASRNSYTMMMNVGVTEGIAWTDEEYVEWGVRLGKDAILRQQIAWKLRQSRQTSPLWNAKQFTREMEKAYEEMWAKYIQK